MLGRGASDEKVDEWLRAGAGLDGYIGFAIGRSIFAEAVKAYAADPDGFDREAATDGHRASNYLRFIEVYEGAHAAPRRLELARELARGEPAARMRPDAGVAQLVEHQLPKLRVEGSSPFARFTQRPPHPSSNEGARLRNASRSPATDVVALTIDRGAVTKLIRTEAALTYEILTTLVGRLRSHQRSSAWRLGNLSAPRG